MSLFKLKKHKQFSITDPYFLRFELLDAYTPENNSDIKEILDDVSTKQIQDGEPPLNETLPFATFKAAEDFFSRLRQVAAKEASPIKFAYFAIWKYNQDEKVKPGKKNSSKGNPHEFISFNKPGYEFTVSSEYQNMTPQLFEVIFNDPDNIDISYVDKKEYCETIRQAYLDSTHLTEDEIAILPSPEETENGSVTLQIPSLSHKAVKESPVYDATTGKFTFSSADNTEKKGNKVLASQKNDNSQPHLDDGAHDIVTVNNQGIRTFDKPKEPKVNKTQPANLDSDKSTQRLPSRTTRKKLEDQVEEQTSLARAKGHVDAPQFAILELDPVDPGHKGYVEYKINQRKKTFNKQLLSIAKEVSNKNEKAIINSQRNFRKSIDDAISGFHKQHAKDEDQIFTQIQTDMKSKKENDYNKQVDSINLNEQNALKQAETNYHQQIANIKHKTKLDKAKLEEVLTKKYTTQAEQQFTKDLAKHDTELKQAENDLVHKLTLKYELISREEAAKLRADGDKVLRDAFSSMNNQLADLQVKANKENNTAKEVSISKQRVENEKLRLESPAAELEAAHQKIEQIQARLSAAETDRNHYKKIADNQEAALHANKSKIEELNATINNLTTKKATDKVNETNNKSADLLNNLIALQVSQQMKNNPVNAQQQVQIPQQQAQPASNNQLNTAMRGFKRLTIGFTATLILVIAGGSYAFAQQQSKYNQQLAANTKTMNEKITAAQNKSQPESQSEVNRKALMALHENSKSKLNQYSGEKYYDLDKAIIDNDATATNEAVKALGNDLNLQDHYRAAQAQTLLQKAGNSSLATKVGDANK